MHKYKFDFEDLLEVKSQEEDNIKNNLLYENKKLETKKTQLNSLFYKREKESNNFKNNKNLKLSDINNFHLYMDNIYKEIKKTKLNILIHQEKIEKIRKDLLEISKEKQMLEKMEEKEKEEYKENIKTQENKINDEITSYRYYLNKA